MADLVAICGRCDGTRLFNELHMVNDWRLRSKQEIESFFDQEIYNFFSYFMRLKVAIISFNKKFSVDQSFDHEIESLKSIIFYF
jgi:hypothetical protein